MDILKTYKEENILFLRGVFLTDCPSIEDIFDEILISKACETSYPSYEFNKIIYDKIPSKFIDMASWKKTTNLYCWNCDTTFLSIPVPCPKNIEIDKSGKEVMEVEGVFCSFNCLLAWVNDKFSDRMLWERKQLIKLLYKRFYASTYVQQSSSQDTHSNASNISNPLNTEICPAPSKYLMTRYGGDITTEQYRAMITKINTSYHTDLANSKIGNITIS